MNESIKRLLCTTKYKELLYECPTHAEVRDKNPIIPRSPGDQR